MEEGGRNNEKQGTRTEGGRRDRKKGGVAGKELCHRR